jgi:hypothetical protein
VISLFFFFNHYSQYERRINLNKIKSTRINTLTRKKAHKIDHQNVPEGAIKSNWAECLFQFEIRARFNWIFKDKLNKGARK